MDYAKNDGEQNFIFLTKDNGFINQKEALKDDFYRQTSRTIEILSYIEPTTPKNSSTSQILTDTKDQKNNEDIIGIYRSLENFRQELITSLDNIIFDIDFDNWGQEIRIKRFEISTSIDYGFLYEFKNNSYNNYHAIFQFKVNSFPKKTCKFLMFFLCFFEIQVFLL
ncbi:hypothetical protein [[Clostridium] innocuum]|uniref:hypothetical protein n=1 Tax=Clostridium innocuum TaxID=1522 RepID=UPI0022E10F0A|nr:hypothetical protein [[Clostridium] innocuum]